MFLVLETRCKICKIKKMMMSSLSSYYLSTAEILILFTIAVLCLLLDYFLNNNNSELKVPYTRFMSKLLEGDIFRKEKNCVYTYNLQVPYKFIIIVCLALPTLLPTVHEKKNTKFVHTYV